MQITTAESLGIVSRSLYHDSSGALRDIVQNHLLQLLCLVAMEPPNDLQQDSIRNEKVKVLKSLKPLPSEKAAEHGLAGSLLLTLRCSSGGCATLRGPEAESFRYQLHIPDTGEMLLKETDSAPVDPLYTEALRPALITG